MAVQEESQYKLFFDESTVPATDSTLELSLMGSLIVPEIFYNLNSIQGVPSAYEEFVSIRNRFKNFAVILYI